MTNDEAKKALFEKLPVKHNGIEYARITAIIYRCDQNGGGNLLVSAELLDKGMRSVTIAQIKDVSLCSE